MMARHMFDPARLARLEAEGWRAYYDRKWLRAFWLLVRLCREQFRLPWPRAVLAGYYATRASVAFAPVKNDLARTLLYLTRFYTLARPAIGMAYHPAEVALHELDYWVVHRQLVHVADKRLLEQSLAALHAALFGLPRAVMHESAVYRAAAAIAVDRITNHRSADVAADWRAVEDNLRAAYQSIRTAVAGALSARLADPH